MTVERTAESENSDYDFDVMIYTGDLADGQARKVIDTLAVSTDLALGLFDETDLLVEKRPTVSRAG